MSTNDKIQVVTQKTILPNWPDLNNRLPQESEFTFQDLFAILDTVLSQIQQKFFRDLNNATQVLSKASPGIIDMFVASTSGGPTTSKVRAVDGIITGSSFAGNPPTATSNPTTTTTPSDTPNPGNPKTGYSP